MNKIIITILVAFLVCGELGSSWEKSCVNEICTGKIYGGEVNMLVDGEYIPFHDAVSMSENDGVFTIITPDGSILIHTKIKDKNGEKTFKNYGKAIISQDTPSIVKKKGLIKYQLDIRNLDIKDDIEYISFKIETPLKLKKETKHGYVIENKYLLDFSDLENSGWQTERLSNEVRVKNLGGKSSILLDPTVTLFYNGTGDFVASFWSSCGNPPTDACDNSRNNVDNTHYVGYITSGCGANEREKWSHAYQINLTQIAGAVTYANLTHIAYSSASDVWMNVSFLTSKCYDCGDYPPSKTDEFGYLIHNTGFTDLDITHIVNARIGNNTKYLWVYYQVANQSPYSPTANALQFPLSLGTQYYPYIEFEYTPTTSTTTITTSTTTTTTSTTTTLHKWWPAGPGGDSPAWLVNGTLSDYLLTTTNYTDGALDVGGLTFNVTTTDNINISILSPMSLTARRFIVWDYNTSSSLDNYTIYFYGLESNSGARVTQVCDSGDSTLHTGTTTGTGTWGFEVWPACSGSSPIYSVVVEGQTCITDQYTSNYNYNISFKIENNNSIYDFTTPSWLDVICPNYGADKILLSGIENERQYYTREHPILSLKIDSGNQLREQTMTTDDGNIIMYLPIEQVPLIRWTLKDFTSRYRNSILYIERSINNTYQDINSRRWGVESEIYTSLYNNTPYHIYLIREGESTSIRDYGFVTVQSTDTAKTIEVTEINLNQQNIDRFQGGLQLVAFGDLNSKTISLQYNKSSNLDWIQVNFYVRNQTIGNEYLLYESPQYNNTSDGIISLGVSNESLTYIARIHFQNEGHTINTSIKRIIYLTNATLRLANLNLPATFGGVTANTLYILFSIGLMIITGIAFTSQDNDYGSIIVTSVGGLCYLIGWFQGIRNVGFVLFFGFGLGFMFLLAKRRYG